MLCWMTKLTGPKGARDVATVKDLTARSVMAQALTRRMHISALFQGLIESAASALASGVIVDVNQKALCGLTDEQHIDAACERFREAARAALVDARRELLQVGAPN